MIEAIRPGRYFQWHQAGFRRACPPLISSLDRPASASIIVPPRKGREAWRCPFPSHERKAPSVRMCLAAGWRLWGR